MNFIIITNQPNESNVFHAIIKITLCETWNPADHWIEYDSIALVSHHRQFPSLDYRRKLETDVLVNYKIPPSNRNHGVLKSGLTHASFLSNRINLSIFARRQQILSSRVSEFRAPCRAGYFHPLVHAARINLVTGCNPILLRPRFDTDRTRERAPAKLLSLSWKFHRRLS